MNHHKEHLAHYNFHPHNAILLDYTQLNFQLHVYHQYYH